MTPYETSQLDQMQIEQRDSIAEDFYLDGVTDGAHSQLPRWNNADYLRGYLVGISRIPADPAGRIEHPASYPNPYQQFAFGLIDSPDPCCGEF